MADDDTLLPFPKRNYRRANELHNRGEPISFGVHNKNKSCAQVAPSVEQNIVQQKPGGLKPNKIRPFNIGIRLTPHEREIVVQQAEKWGLTISEYVRKAAVEPLQPISKDPERYRHLENICRELKRQGTNLNQIARKFNAHVLSPPEAESLVHIIARPLMQAYQAVCHAMTEGKSEA